jgi:hypothetical protein
VSASPQTDPQSSKTQPENNNNNNEYNKDENNVGVWKQTLQPTDPVRSLRNAREMEFGLGWECLKNRSASLNVEKREYPIRTNWGWSVPAKALGTKLSHQ